jgi:hypothetical protein
MSLAYIIEHASISAAVFFLAVLFCAFALGYLIGNAAHEDRPSWRSLSRVVRASRGER